jgi:hypothetical protein
MKRRSGGMDQVVDHLPTKGEALSSKPSAGKKERKEGREREERERERERERQRERTKGRKEERKIKPINGLGQLTTITNSIYKKKINKLGM